MKTITLLILAFLSPFLMASNDNLYEVSTHLVVDKEILGKYKFTTQAYDITSRTYEDNKANTYQVFYKIVEGKESGTLEISAKVEKRVVDISFLVNDNEGASFISKQDVPEIEVVVKAHKLSAKTATAAPSEGAKAVSNNSKSD